MKIKMPRALQWLAAVCVLAVVAAAQTVRITELMYHPASENPKEEFVELFNAGPAPVALDGWRFSTGVRFTFPPVTLAPGAYLAVAADLATFTTNHPTVTNVVGNWDGILSNSGQLLELVDAQGKRVDAIRYADDGDWGRRELEPIDYGHRGLGWHTPADGGGPSLELVNLALPNKHGQNWTSSSLAGGTPGQLNSVAETNSAPLILEVEHFPIIPRSTNTVTVTARILDELTTGLTVTLHHRRDGEPAFASSPMVMDGLHGQGVFAVTLPAETNGTVVEFYIAAADADGRTRTFPAPAWLDGTPGQVANLLYQVDDTVHDSALPVYKAVLKAADVAELRQINTNNPRTPPFPTSDQTRSHAQFNGSFISLDGQGIELRYTVGIRNRGNGSRVKSPQSFRVNFLNADEWKDVVSLNLNGQYPHAQLLGSALYRSVGLACQSSRAVQVWVNGVNRAAGGASGYDYYVANEVINSQFAGHAFPLDSSGNLYRGIRLTDIIDPSAIPLIHSEGADLHYLGGNTNLYRQNYFKQSNTSEDDWSDLMALTRILEHEPEATYADAVRGVVNVEAWMRYFALETLVDNRETNLGNGNNGTGEGDDYFLYFGVNDPRSAVVPYDLDTILGEGDTAGRVEDGLFRMSANPVIARLMRHPDFAPVYYRELKRIVDTALAPAPFAEQVEQTLGGLVSDTVKARIKQFAAARRDFVLSQIPLALVISNALPVSSWGQYHVSASDVIALAGQASVLETRAVTVNGLAANWTAWQGVWTAPTVTLAPGFNRVLVQTWDAGGRERERATTDVFVTPAGNGTPQSGTLAADATWTAAGGPHMVSGRLIVPAGVTLTIEPGTTVAFASQGGLEIRGRLLAEGTESQRIAFVSAWNSSNTWGGVLLNGTGKTATRIAWAHFEGAGSSGYNVRATGSTLFLSHCTFANTSVQYVDLINSSFEISDCVFPKTAGLELIHGSGLPADGFGILRRNFFGGTSGYNDIIDFTGGNRPGAIVQFLDNVFAAATDDCFDMDGTDAHIEGNLFLNVRQDAPRASTSNAVTTGGDGGNTSELTVVRNIFYNVDHALLLKDQGSAVFHNNTAVNITDNPNDTAPGALITFYEARPGVTSGKLADLDGNIIWQVVEGRLVNDFTNPPAQLLLRNSVLPAAPPAGAVSERVVVEDPRFAGGTTDLTVDNVRTALALRPGSPALGAGPNGLDMGALVPAGASISGEPPPVTWKTNATLVIAGPGITHYRWRLDGGDWSIEVPVSEPLTLTGLPDGDHQVEVIGRNSAGVWQAEAEAARSQGWTVNRAHARVVINEVLAKNLALPLNGGFPDLVEIFNDSAAPVDLGGLGLGTSPTNRHAFTFPPGTTLASEGHLVLLADSATNAPGLHLGFALEQSGETLYLSDTAAHGSNVLDSVTWGPQVPGLSIGRTGRAGWGLTQPSFGEPNVRARTGDPATLRLNEWLAATDAFLPDDFVELFNPDPLPVALAGLMFTDQPSVPAPFSPDPVGPPSPPVSPPPGTMIPSLSFIPGRGFAAFTADGHAERGSTHLDFKLAAEQGVVSLVELGGVPARVTRVIDAVLYGPQTPGVSQGRSPNGGAAFAFFHQPSPGGGNPGGVVETNVVTLQFPLVALTNVWRYWQTGAPDAAWLTPGFEDLAWPAGAAPLGYDRDTLPVPLQTPLTLGRMTYYFRSHFNCPTNPAGMTLRLQTFIDDGAVFWLNGQPLHRENLSAPLVTDTTPADDNLGNATLRGPVDLVATNLIEGDNLLAVEVHQENAGSGDIVFALALEGVVRVTNTVGGEVLARLNEVYGAGRATTNATFATTDWIELYNPGPQASDLSDCSLTDDASVPRKWVFPAGTVLAAGEWRVILCDALLPVSATNTGFGLSSESGGVFLYDRPAPESRLLDSVRYGLQAAGFTVGRVPDAAGPWQLNLPSAGAGNGGATTGDPALLRVNEWLARPTSGADWFELFNPGALPVALGGLFFTDHLETPALSEVPPLSFIGARAFVVFQADEQPGKGANHVNFKLAAEGETVALLTPERQVLEAVAFGPQALGVSEGRLPDGAATIARFPGRATPGAANAADPLADTDVDGMPDVWENQFGLSANDPTDAAGDLDGDGLKNLAEYRAGTRPDLAASTLRLDATSAGGFVNLLFDGVEGRTYTVFYRDDLGAGTWVKLRDTGPVNCNCSVAVIDPSPPGGDGAQRFYRVVTPAAP